MSFEKRNESWKGMPREFRQINSRSGTPRVWRVWVQGPNISYQWGQLNGAMQTASEVSQGVNIGKSNEMSPELYALNRAREMCRKKNWEGYRECDLSGNPLDPPVKTEIDFNKLPLSLSFYKPDNSMGSGITKKAEAGKVWYSRKRNGMMKVIAKGDDGDLKIYSRRMLRQHDDEQKTEFTWDDRFPFIIHALQPHVPANSILLGELVVEENGIERFDLAQSYIKSLTPKTVEDMEKSGLFPFFYCWDIAFWGGVDLLRTSTFRSRFDLMVQLASQVRNPQYFQPNHVMSFRTPEEAVEHAKKNHMEGWVVIDPDESYEEKGYNFKGKPDRPRTACAKLKPAYEDDFVVFWDPEKGWGERSKKDRFKQGIKSVAMFQYNSSGQLVFISNVASGLTEEMKTKMAKPKLYPRVWKIEYTDRRYQSQGDDTNALDFARFIEERTDKKPEECINSQL